MASVETADSSSSLSSLSNADLPPVVLDHSFFGVSADAPLFSNTSSNAPNASTIAPFASLPFVPPPSSPPPKDASSKKSPPPRKKAGGFSCFACLGTSGAEETSAPGDLESSSRDSISSQDQEGKGAASPVIPNFLVAIAPCKVDDRVSLDHLHSLQPQLFENFYSFLKREHAEENLDAWLALDAILHISTLADCRAAIARLYSELFAPDADQRLGCSEIYPLMDELLHIAQQDAQPDEVWSPVDSLHSSIRIIKVRLEHSSESSISTTLHRWERLCLTGN